MANYLTEKQKKFCEEYLIDLNATQAAIRAGYSENTAYSIGSENLTKPEIQEYLSQRQKELQEATGITQKRVLEEFAKIAFADIRKVYTVDNRLLDVTQFDDEISPAVQSVKSYEEYMDGEAIGTNKEIKFHDKLKALEALSKHLGLFKEHNSQKQQSQITIFELPDNGRDNRE